MLYKANIIIDLPGNDPDDAVARLRARVPGWPIEVVSIDLADKQPAAITGTAAIKLPLPKATAR